MEKEDTNNVKLRNALCYAYVNIDPAQGDKVYGESALAMAREIRLEKGHVATACKMLGVNYMSRSDYLKSLEYALKSLKINEDLGDQKSACTAITGILANIYNNQGKIIPLRLIIIQGHCKIFEELGLQKTVIAITLGNVGNTYNNLNNYAKDLEYSIEGSEDVRGAKRQTHRYN